MGKGVMNRSDPPNWQVELDRLRAEFDARIPSVFDQIRQLSQASTATDELNTQIRPLIDTLHKLAGSAGTFGRPRLGQVAKQFEEALILCEKGLGDRSLLLTQLSTAYQQDLATAKEGSGSAARVDYASVPATPKTTSEIWLLEDERVLGENLKAQLASFNFNARLFTAFEDLQAALESEQPEVIVLDVVLEGEGISADLLQSADFTSSLSASLLFVSSSDNFAHRLKASELKAEAYFLKPLDVPKLISRIEQVISRRHAPPERVLIVDDDKLLADHYETVLSRAGMVATQLRDADGVISAIETFRPDLILMDLQMPEMSGQDLAGVIRQYDRWFSLPIVYLSSEQRFDIQMAAIRQGGDDFIGKSVSDDELIALVRAKVARSRQLQELMTKDSLTGLLKHTSVKDAISGELSRSRRTGGELCVAMLDIDHFKRVNDDFGHAAGDEVIESVATLFRQRFRATDIIGRYGGEEFAVALPGCSADQADKLLNEFRVSLSQLTFVNRGNSFSVTISGGYTVLQFTAQAPCTVDALLAEADVALYQAKDQGRNRIIRFNA